MLTETPLDQERVRAFAEKAAADLRAAALASALFKGVSKPYFKNLADHGPLTVDQLAANLPSVGNPPKAVIASDIKPWLEIMVMAGYVELQVIPTGAGTDYAYSMRPEWRPILVDQSPLYVGDFTGPGSKLALILKENGQSPPDGVVRDVYNGNM